ncbi:MAG: HAD family hydrolase [Nocardioidaceae bacterium]
MDGSGVRLAVWSGPRSISTALMRSWENRTDSMVVDEPFYAHYLAATGVDHPGREDVITAGDTDWRRVVAALTAPLPNGVAVFYQKHMAHHLTPDIERGWIALLTNVLLIRDPSHVVASYLRSRDEVSSADLGIHQQVYLYDELCQVDRAPWVIDSADFLTRPGDYLEALCGATGLEFEPGMLSWPAGPRDTDGVWAPHWYDAVTRSTGFGAYEPHAVHLTGPAADVAAECRPGYDRLRAVRWVP